MRIGSIPAIGKSTGASKRRDLPGGFPSGIALFVLIFLALMFAGKGTAAEKANPPAPLTEQELATEKFLSSLEGALSQKFFDYRKRPKVRVAVLDFTDGEGNVVKAGVSWADLIARRLYSRSQFEVISHDQVIRYLSWNSLGTVGRLDASSLRVLQRRINTMDPGNGIHALITGEVKKGAGRSLQVQAYLVNFEFKVGAVELENNLVDSMPLLAEIPLPTEQALQEAGEILVRGEKQTFTEGRLVVLANTRGYPLIDSEYLNRFQKDQSFEWEKIPYVLMVGKEDYTMPKQVQVGAGNVILTALQLSPGDQKRLEHSFLHGKCATNEVYFDEMIPAMKYRISASFVDLRNGQTYSDLTEVEVYPGATTVVVLSFFVPSEKERIRSGILPRINIFHLYGKGLEILPRG
jgi:hypothetical protein